MSEAEQSARSKTSRAGEQIPTYPLVGTTSSKVASRNPNRRQLIFINNSTVDMMLDTRQGVTTSIGVPLGSDGGEVQILEEEDGNLVKEEWWAIAGAASSQLVVKEVLKQ